MTLEELHDQLIRCQSLSECDTFLKHNLHSIRPLFYGLTKKQLQGSRFNYEDVFVAFINSQSGKAIYTGHTPPASVFALLIFFLSLFERAHLYTVVHQCASLIPPEDPLRKQCEAIFKYKNIQNSDTDYLERFDDILKLLQSAWDNSSGLSRSLSEDILKEYIFDAFMAPSTSNSIRQNITALLRASAAQQHYPLLSNSLIDNLSLDSNISVDHERDLVRSRIVEALHEQACDLVPECLRLKIAGKFVGENAIFQQNEIPFPTYLSNQLIKMGAVFNPQRQGARQNHEGDAEWNRMYLGTYFPRTVIESRQIFSELLSIPIVRAAYQQKEIIRFLDVGSGTGAAITGALLALADWGGYEGVVNVMSLDANEDALAKQRVILDLLQDNLPFKLVVNFRQEQFPFDLDGFVEKFSAIADEEEVQYDMIFFWKCLSEFYNANFAQAQGIIHHAVEIASRMLLPYGLCIVADVTTTDNGFEYFSCTLNREVNEHDITKDAKTRTILPLPCGRGPVICTEKSCYTQRYFSISHPLSKNDKSKITYRIVAPISFAQSITTSFYDATAYGVNAAKPNQACLDGHKTIVNDKPICGFTGFFDSK